jgi:hypothetical protein
MNNIEAPPVKRPDRKVSHKSPVGVYFYVPICYDCKQPRFHTRFYKFEEDRYVRLCSHCYFKRLEEGMMDLEAG